MVGHFMGRLGRGRGWMKKRQKFGGEITEKCFIIQGEVCIIRSGWCDADGQIGKFCVQDL